MTSNDLRAAIHALPHQIAARPHLGRLGALFTETVLIEVSGLEFYLHFEKGALAQVTEGPSRKIPWRFAVRTDLEALKGFWAPLPAPGYHDLFGLAKIGRAQIDGDILALVRNLRFFKEVMALPRPPVETAA